MPISLADYSAKVAAKTEEPVLFAVVGDAPGGWGTIGAVPVAVGLGAIFGVGPMMIGALLGHAADTVSKKRLGRRSRFARVVLAFTATELIEYDWPAGRRSPRGVNLRLPASLVTLHYERTAMAVATRLSINGHQWTVHGWFERDLRSAIANSVWSERLVPTG